MRLHVDAIPDEYGAPRPLRLCLESGDIAVTEICDRWDGAAHRYYKVRGEDGGLYIIRIDEPHDAWSLVFYRAETGGGADPVFPAGAARC